jgi:hypothetical protein
MIQSSACQPWHVDPPGLAGEYGGPVGTYTISWDTIPVNPQTIGILDVIACFLSVGTKRKSPCG